MDREKEGEQLLLYRLARLLRELFPNGRTENPFGKEKEMLSRCLGTEEQLLFADLLHGITLLNGGGRIELGGRCTSDRSDLLSAFQLVLPPELRLTPMVMAVHAKLLEQFGEGWFTYLDACRKLRKSKKTLKRYLRPLELYGLVEREQSNASSLAYLRVLEAAKESPKGIFEQANEEWEDFVGFVEF